MRSRRLRVIPGAKRSDYVHRGWLSVAFLAGFGLMSLIHGGLRSNYLAACREEIASMRADMGDQQRAVLEKANELYTKAHAIP